MINKETGSKKKGANVNTDDKGFDCNKKKSSPIVCPITNEEDYLVLTKCCKNKIGFKTMARISLGGDGIVSKCPYCNSTKVELGIKDRLKIIKEASEVAQNEYKNLPIRQALLLKEYIDLSFCKSRMQSIAGILLKMLHFPLAFFQHYISLPPLDLSISIDHAVQDPARMYLDDLIYDLVGDVLKLLRENLKIALKGDAAIVVEIMLGKVKEVCIEYFKIEVRIRHMPTLVPILAELVKKEIKIFKEKELMKEKKLKV